MVQIPPYMVIHIHRSLQTIRSQSKGSCELGMRHLYDESKNHYIQGTWGYSDEFGNSKEVTMLLPNDEDVNKLKFEIENLNVGTTVNSVLLIEVAKQFESYVNGDISLEDSINKVVDNLDLYLSE